MLNQASLEGPRAGPLLAGILSIALVGLCAGVYWSGEGSLDSVRLIDRITIRIAVVLFSLIFAAAPLRAFFPSKITRCLFSNQGNLTILFVIAFALHLCAIARFYSLDDTLFWSVSPIYLIALRGLGVVFIALILVRSLSDSVADSWKFPAAFGFYYIWAAFLAGFAKRIVLDHFYSLPVVLLIVVLILRVAGLIRRV